MESAGAKTGHAGAGQGTIDDFIARSQPQVQNREEEVTIAKDTKDVEWDQYAPGVDADDYKPKPDCSTPLPPPILPLTDTGRTPNSFIERRDVEDIFAEPGVCGLLNMGNTCYMNAGLQCVRSVPQLALFYLSDNVPSPDMEKEEKAEAESDGEENTSIVQEKEEEVRKNDKVKKKDPSLVAQGHVSARFSVLVRKLWSGKFSALLPKSFKTTLGLLYPQFGGFRQQDSHEFLAILLDRLHEDVVQSKHSCGGGQKDGVNSQEQKSRSIITDTFQGQLTNEVTCCSCGHVSTKTDPFIYLSLPLPHSNETQLDVSWVPLCRTAGERKVIKLLITVSKLATLADVKQGVCEVIGGRLLPDSVVMVYVKSNAVECVLSDSLAIKQLKSPNECSLYAYETEISSGSVVNKNAASTASGTDSHRPKPEAVEVTPMMEKEEEVEEGLPAKMLRCDTATPEPMECDDSSNTAQDLDGGSGGGGGEPGKAVVMEWHSCAICLEEMVDEELLTHASCGAVLCSTCLHAAQQHGGGGGQGDTSGTGSFSCPVCQVLVGIAAFTPLATKDKSDSVVRLLQVTVVFRYQGSDDNTWRLASHPAVINLPCSATGEHYHSLLSPFLPSTPVSYTLSLTDWKGYYCSRCEFTAHCSGCLIAHSRETVSLKPGDHISVSMSLEDIEAPLVSSHPSQDERWTSSASLLDCVELFSQSELLSKDNPWYCPTCEQNQAAYRQLRVSSLPPTLIIHLKRFLFHGGVASKVDMCIDFPTSFSSSIFTNLSSAPSDLVLTACVCHFGSVDSGHYTAYSQHPLTNQWHYYNDETVTETSPSQEHKKQVYMLFYQQQQEQPKQEGSAVSSSPLSRCVDLVEFPTEQEELHQMNQLLRVFKPKPPPCPPALPPVGPIRRSSSLGNIADTSGESDRQLQLALAASLGLDLPPPSPEHPPPPAPPLVRSSSSSNLTQTVSANSKVSNPDYGTGITLVSAKMKSFDA